MLTLLHLKPFIQAKKLKFEIFNEVISVLFCYTLFTFIGDLPNKQHSKESFGWVAIGILLFYILVHMSFQLKDFTGKMIDKVKQKCIKKRTEKNEKQI